jgi:uncharacterized short protein YbdD (DUF466 family)
MGKGLMAGKLRVFWRMVRRLSGDDAYEHYLLHHARHHQAEAGHESCPPLGKAEFFKRWQDEKWNGIKRCC